MQSRLVGSVWFIRAVRVVHVLAGGALWVGQPGWACGHTPARPTPWRELGVGREPGILHPSRVITHLSCSLMGSMPAWCSASTFTVAIVSCCTRVGWYASPCSGAPELTVVKLNVPSASLASTCNSAWPSSLVPLPLPPLAAVSPLSCGGVCRLWLVSHALKGFVPVPRHSSQH